MEKDMKSLGCNNMFWGDVLVVVDLNCLLKNKCTKDAIVK